MFQAGLDSPPLNFGALCRHIESQSKLDKFHAHSESSYLQIQYVEGTI